MNYQLLRVFKYNNYQLSNGAVYQKRKLFSNHCPRTRVNSSETSTFLTTLTNFDHVWCRWHYCKSICTSCYKLHNDTKHAIFRFKQKLLTMEEILYSQFSSHCFLFSSFKFFFRSKWIILRISYMSLFNKSSVFLLLQSNVFYSSFNHDTTEKQFVRTAENKLNKKFELVPDITSN